MVLYFSGNQNALRLPRSGRLPFSTAGSEGPFFCGEGGACVPQGGPKQTFNAQMRCGRCTKQQCPQGSVWTRVCKIYFNDVSRFSMLKKFSTVAIGPLVQSRKSLVESVCASTSDRCLV